MPTALVPTAWIQPQPDAGMGVKVGPKFCMRHTQQSEARDDWWISALLDTIFYLNIPSVL